MSATHAEFNGRQASPEISVIMPAHNEEAVIGDVVGKVVATLEGVGRSFEILVIDDGSKDNTATVAESAGARVIRHAYNIGNGAAIKTGFRNAEGEIFIMLDSDGQHDPADIPGFLEDMDTYDLSIGARQKASETTAHRDFGNAVFNALASYVGDRKIEDLTSGFRAVRRSVALEFIHFLPNSYSYPTTLTLSAIRAGYSVNFRPIVARKRVGKSGIRVFVDGPRFLMIIMRICVFFAPLKVFLPASFGLFLLGLIWYLGSIVFSDRPFPPFSMLLMQTSVIVFCFGLISEQISRAGVNRSK